MCKGTSSSTLIVPLSEHCAIAGYELDRADRSPPRKMGPAAPKPLMMVPGIVSDTAPLQNSAIYVGTVWRFREALPKIGPPSHPAERDGTNRLSICRYE